KDPVGIRSGRGAEGRFELAQGKCGANHRLQVNCVMRDRPDRVQEILVILSQRTAQYDLVVVEDIWIDLDWRASRVNAGVDRHDTAFGSRLHGLFDSRG